MTTADSPSPERPAPSAGAPGPRAASGPLSAPGSTVLTGLAEAAGSNPHTAGVFLPEGPPGRGAAGWRAITYDQLRRRARAIAGGLGEIGLAPGDRVVLLVPPSADFFALTFGLLEAGVVPVLIDPGIGRDHLKRCLDEADPRGFIGTAKAHAARLALRWAPRAQHHVIAAGPGVGGTARSGAATEVATALLRSAARRRGDGSGTSPQQRSQGVIPLSAVERRGADVEPAGPVDGTAAILFTSGSTGPPKGVEYTHDNLAAQVIALSELYGLGADDVQLATFPPFALFGPSLGMPTVVPRMDPTRPADVDPTNIVEALRAFNATVMFGSPALLDTVSAWAIDRGVRLTGLRLVMSAGAPVSLRIVAATSSVLDASARLVTPYGATEALPVASVDHRELTAASEPDEVGLGVCVGRPAPGVRVGVMRLTDALVPQLVAGDLVRPGELGEFVVSGRVVSPAYFARPAATAAAKTRWDGKPAHRMGDVGFIDDHGRLWFCGRKAHLITTAEGVVAPVPVETLFNAHRWVARSALIGIGPPGDQRPCLCVELTAAAPSPDVVIAELRGLIEAHERARCVAEIRIHPGFPVDIRHNAKINYPALVAWWQRA